MARLWPFRSLSNFALSVAGCCGVAYYGVGVYRQRYFSNPIVSEAVKILGKNQKIKQMIGYPLSYQSSSKNKFNQEGNELYFNFKVMGPRGSTQVQVTATQLKAKQVYEYDSQNQSLKEAQLKYNQLTEQIVQLQSKINKKSSSSWFGSKKNNPNDALLQQLYAKQKEVGQLKSHIEQTTNEKKQRKNQYCIPQKQYYIDIVSQAGKNNENVLPEDAILYKLQNIACQLPNKSRINVINNGKGVQTQQYQTKLQNQTNFSNLIKPMYGPLHEKLSTNVSELSDEQIQQYSKHKNNFMYQKYNQYRIMTFIMMAIGAGGLFLYFNKNKTKNMSNSVLYQLVLNRLAKNNQVSQILRRNSIKQLDLDRNVGGGMKNNVFNCQISVNNVTMGKIQIEGKYYAKDANYEFNKLIFRYIQDNQHKQVDLLE